MNEQHIEAANKGFNRRTFLAGAATVGACNILPGPVLRAAGQNRKVNVAIIGTGGQGIVNMKQLFLLDDVRIAALCDLNDKSDYSDFYYGGTAGLMPAVELVKQHYGEACPVYKDYKEMLDKEDLDAVLIATPDHSHGYIALDVIAKGKHIYVEKPLCRTIEETRLVTEAAHKAGVATQMGNYGHSNEYIRLASEWIWDGAIGDVHEVHAWCNTGADRWSKYKERPPAEKIPEGFEWKTWCDPMPHRSFSKEYAPVRWRAWWDFGSSTIGDFACHHLDPVFMALKIAETDRFTVEASQVGMTEETCPSAGLVHYDVPARAGMAPVRITWYEGGIKPGRPKELEDGRAFGDHGVIFYGSKGVIMGGGWASDLRIIPETAMRAYKRPAKTLKRVKGHHRDWINACKGLGEASTNFNYAGPLTEFALMGNVALRTGKRLDFDWKNMICKDAPETAKLIKPQYKKSWKS
ncbi:MAG TPA: Gfo/Idh/MocA family oxidoreductase [Verrucomicrobia bacterium]|nr:Gfo/Idh/MocA family oxidoreductase [Verrucomicrobiota bacterium]